MTRREGVLHGNARGMASEKRSRLGGQLTSMARHIDCGSGRGRTDRVCCGGRSASRRSSAPGGCSLYFASQSLLAAGLFLGIAFVVAAPILNFADLLRRTDRKRERQQD